MNIQDYKKNWESADYADAIQNVTEAKSLLNGTLKIRCEDKNIFKIEQLNRLLPAIIQGIQHETKTKAKTTPVLNFTIDNLGRIKRLSMDNPGTKASMTLRSNYELLYCALPNFASLEPVPPAIQGSTSFIAMVETTIKTLPKSIRQKIQDVTVIETNSKEIFGIALQARKKVIHVLTNNSNTNLSRTVLHEIGHCVLGHIDGDSSNKTHEEIENEAKSFAEKYS